MNQNLAKEICEKALEFGYNKCGIISVKDINGFEDELNRREEKFPGSAD